MLRSKSLFLMIKVQNISYVHFIVENYLKIKFSKPLMRNTTLLFSLSPLITWCWHHAYIVNKEKLHSVTSQCLFIIESCFFKHPARSNIICKRLCINANNKAFSILHFSSKQIITQTSHINKCLKPLKN